MTFHDCGDEICLNCKKCKGCEGCECIPNLEVKNPNLITVLWSCGHIWIQLRPAGISDPMNCLCFICNPEPIAYREWLCPDCSTAKIKERYQARN